MARMTVVLDSILPRQEAFLVDAPTPTTSPHRWIQVKSTKPPGTRHEGFGERRYVALAYMRRSRVVVQFTHSTKPDPPTNCNPWAAPEGPR